MEKIKNQVGIISENVGVLTKRREYTRRQMRVSVDMLAKRLVDEYDTSGADGIYSAFVELCPSADARDRARVCHTLCSEHRLAESLRAKNLYSCGDGATAQTQGKIAYVKNLRSDDAFLTFATRGKGAKAMYVGSFSEACEAVFDNVCEFCILPIENGREGKLYSFYSMLDRYELKICDVASCETDDGAESITFALVSRGVVSRTDFKGIRRFEFSLIDESDDILTDILLAANELGGRVVSVGTQPVPYDELKNLYYFSIDFPDAAADSMALYINEEYPRYTSLGLYEIKHK